MTASDLSIRVMAQDELGLALDWAAEEGWNPGLADAASFYAADPGGFLVGEIGGEPVGCVSAVRYGDFGFLGFYIVKPPFRGRGYGLALWRAAMDRLAGRVVGLDGVLAQQDNYIESGFRLAWRNIRHEGVGGGRPPEGLADLASVPFDAVEACDRTIFPAERRRFLERWIRPPQGAALAAVEAGALRGYGVLRACRRGFKIGPLIADRPDVAERLFRGLAARAAGAPLFLDTPEVNPDAVALAKRHGMTPVFETARMYTGEPPPIKLDRCFGVTTFELG
ncbi:acetyltransferase (GNAT) family protein [Roseiarcus fermentans]|uniref:Acetyltransferase (GNAT) family protein n=1 Tax=Roseiarcus fermentans TaxID=1473586 RepID=A0A366FWW4_9HYPH|nr:GNAT family N-acetyltransferase [Roseiarcus fermentans]RBP18189.1 acetyltransferase (GNAT) family protein [Roseiarcus fermentans]